MYTALLRVLERHPRHGRAGSGIMLFVRSAMREDCGPRQAPNARGAEPRVVTVVVDVDGDEAGGGGDDDGI